MPSAAEYIEQTKRDKAARHALEKVSAPEWIITEALHHVEAVLAQIGDNGQPHCDHRSRNKLIREDSRFQKVRKDYRKLYDLSMWARYLIPQGDSKGPRHQTMIGVTNGWLSKIQNFAQEELSKAAKSA